MRNGGRWCASFCALRRGYLRRRRRSHMVCCVFNTVRLYFGDGCGCAFGECCVRWIGCGGYGVIRGRYQTRQTVLRQLWIHSRCCRDSKWRRFGVYTSRAVHGVLSVRQSSSAGSLVRANGRRSGRRSKEQVDSCAISIHVVRGNDSAVVCYGVLVCDGDEGVGMRRRRVRVAGIRVVGWSLVRSA